MTLPEKIKETIEKEFSDIIVDIKDMLARQSIGSNKIRCFIKGGNEITSGEIIETYLRNNTL